jgi:uncharacterized protein (TIGR00255 family)
MIRSMTAFAASEAKIGMLNINCELRSVNHRYCDISLKLPEPFRCLEMVIRKAIANKIKRGKIECTLSYKRQIQDAQGFNINMAAVAALLAATGKIEQKMQNPQPFSALDILAVNGIQQEPQFDTEAIAKGIDRLINDALETLLEFRTREGHQLEQILLERCQLMQQQVEAAKKLMPEVLQKLHVKLKSRIVEMVAEPDFDRLEQELVILTQKLDVSEELDRLETHITEVLNILTKDEAAGRKLDFLMQEMNREANTLGSKSADKKITQISIELKVLIEQMREQIQNIE